MYKTITPSQIHLINKKKQGIGNNKSLEIINSLRKKYIFEKVDKFDYLGVIITGSGHERTCTQESVGRGRSV